MVIRPLNIKRTSEDFKDYLKMSQKAQKSKKAKANPLIRMNRIFITSVLLCSVMIVTCILIHLNY
jgi:hypothetical protein